LLGQGEKIDSRQSYETGGKQICKTGRLVAVAKIAHGAYGLRQHPGFWKNRRAKVGSPPERWEYEPPPEPTAGQFEEALLLRPRRASPLPLLNRAYRLRPCPWPQS